MPNREGRGLERFLLRFEPERVLRDTWHWEDHPERFLSPADLPHELGHHETEGFLLFALGHRVPLAKKRAGERLRAARRQHAFSVPLASPPAPPPCGAALPRRTPRGELAGEIRSAVPSFTGSDLSSRGTG